MRMWLLPPETLCREHLLGEHKELHMLAGCIMKKKSIQGYLDRRIAEPMSIVGRHAKLVREMKARGYRHQSPLIDVARKKLTDAQWFATVDLEKSKSDLHKRCKKCRNLYTKFYGDVE